MLASIDQSGVTVRPDADELVSFDVLFGKRRIWSFSVESGVSGHFTWPESLAKRLYGTSDVEVRYSSDQRPVAKARIRFDDAPREFRLLDDRGRPLMVNKWQRLAPALVDGESGDLRDALLEVIAHLHSTLEELAYSAFAVGGTALGPFRDGDLLPFDDDGDLAVFIDVTHHVDVSRSILKLSRELRARGYRVRVHSLAHLQVYPPPLNDFQGLYVDVFAAFIANGYVNQPFHVRSPFSREQLVPFKPIEARGVKLPVARDTEAWLTANYGLDWRVPQPGFEIRTPPETKRRFHNWFGSFNLHRHFWDAWAQEGGQDYQRLLPRMKKFTFESRIVLNVGSGIQPGLPDGLANSADRPKIIALDYSDRARELCKQGNQIDSTVDIELNAVNFGNYSEVLALVRQLPAEPFDIYAGFSIEGQDREKRSKSFMRLVRMSLRSGGRVLIDHVDVLGGHYNFGDPRTWHLPIERLNEEAATAGLEVQQLGRGHVMVAGERRSFTRSEILMKGPIGIGIGVGE